MILRGFSNECKASGSLSSHQCVDKTERAVKHPGSGLARLLGDALMYIVPSLCHLAQGVYQSPSAQQFVPETTSLKWVSWHANHPQVVVRDRLPFLPHLRAFYLAFC
jgi:hypothetical protein